MFGAIGLLDNGNHAHGEGRGCRIQASRCLRSLGQVKRNWNVNALAVVTVVIVFMSTFGRMVAMVRRLRMAVIVALLMENRFELDMTVSPKTQNGTMH